MAETKKISVWSRNFICVIIANFMLCLAHFSVNPLVPSYAIYLNAGPRLMGLLTGMFFGIALAMRPVAGPVITKADKRRLLVGVFALGVIANTGYAFFPNIPSFVAFRVVNGIQYGFIGSLLMTLAGDSLPPERMVSGMGIYGIGSSIGLSVAPTMSSAVLAFGIRISGEALGYRMVFLCSAVILFLAMFVALLMKPVVRNKNEIAAAGRWYRNIFTVHAAPVAAVMLFLTMSYSLYNAYVFNFANEFGISGISIFFTVLAATLLVTRPLSGYLTDKFGIRRIVVPGMFVFAVSFIAVGSARSLPAVLLGAVAAALGYGTAQPTLQAMCVQTVEPVRRGVASNTIYIGMDMGFFLGPVIGGFILTYTGYSPLLRMGSVPAAVALVIFVCALPGYFKRQRELRGE